MTIEKITDYEARAVAELAEQFRGKPRMEAFVQSIAKQVQDLEDAIFDVLLLRICSVATGVSLDGCGEIVGEPRDGRGDDDYRVAIQVRIRQNRSNGEAPTIIEVLAILADSPRVAVINRPDANILVQYEAGIAAATEVQIAIVVNRIRMAGVGVTVVRTEPAGESFGFDEDSDSLGFGDADDASFGGRFSSAIVV